MFYRGPGARSAPPAGRRGKAFRRSALPLLLALALPSSCGEAMEERANRSRVKEARYYLETIRARATAYLAEWGVYVGNQPLLPVAGRGDRVALVFKVVLQSAQHRRIIFDNQYGFSCHCCAFLIA